MALPLALPLSLPFLLPSAVPLQKYTVTSIVRSIVKVIAIDAVNVTLTAHSARHQRARFSRSPLSIYVLDCDKMSDRNLRRYHARTFRIIKLTWCLFKGHHSKSHVKIQLNSTHWKFRRCYACMYVLNAMRCNAMRYHIISYHIVSYNMMFCHVMSCYVRRGQVRSGNAMHCNVLCCNVLKYIMLYCIM